MKFFRPHEQRSKEVSIHFDEMAKDLQKQGFNITMGAVDCMAQLETCTAQDIQTYPTMKLYIKGHPIVYIADEAHPVYPQMFGFLGQRLSARLTRIASPS